MKEKNIDSIKCFFCKENHKLIDDKINKILKDKNRGDCSLKDILIHLCNPEIDFYNLYKNGAKKLAYQGLIIEQKDDEYHYYGEVLNNASIDFLVELIKEINNFDAFDDFLLNDNSQKPIYMIIRLLIFAMNNYFDNYSKLIMSGNGIIDSQINLLTKNGSLYQKVPINDFIYGMFNDGLYTEKQFDKYLNKGSYQLLCEELDKIFANSNDIINNDLVKKQIIAIGNMYNNKLFYLSYYGVINENTKNKLINQFNYLFNQTLKAFSIKFYEEDYSGLEEAMNNSIQRLSVVRTN